MLSLIDRIMSAIITISIIMLIIGFLLAITTIFVFAFQTYEAWLSCLICALVFILFGSALAAEST